jgi:hypothetical protein
MTGGMGQRYDLTKDDVKQKARNGTLFQELVEYKKVRLLMLEKEEEGT